MEILSAEVRGRVGDVALEAVRVRDRGTGRVRTLALLQHPSSALVLPVDYAGSQVLMVHQPRVGAAGAEVTDVAGGRREADEPADVAARRECFEETGLSLRALELVGRDVLVTPDSTARTSLFIGAVVAPSALRPEPGVEARWVPFDALDELIDAAAGFSDSVGMLSPLTLLLLLERHLRRHRSAR